MSTGRPRPARSSRAIRGRSPRGRARASRRRPRSLRRPAWRRRSGPARPREGPSGGRDSARRRSRRRTGSPGTDRVWRGPSLPPRHVGDLPVDGEVVLDPRLVALPAGVTVREARGDPRPPAAAEPGGARVEQRPDLAAGREELEAPEEGQDGDVLRPAQPEERAAELGGDGECRTGPDVAEDEEEEPVLEDDVEDDVRAGGLVHRATAYSAASSSKRAA